MRELQLTLYTYASSPMIIAKIWRYGKGYNKPVNCDMLFDTGATMTTIDKTLAIRAGYSLKNAEDVVISGIGRSRFPAQRIVIPYLELDGNDLGAVSVDVTEFPEHSNIAAILGMNVIRHFKCTFNIYNEVEKQAAQDSDGLITLCPKYDLDEKDSIESFNVCQSRFGIWSVNSELHFRKTSTLE